MWRFLHFCLFQLQVKAWYLWGLCCSLYTWYAQWGKQWSMRSINSLKVICFAGGFRRIIKKICLSAGWWKICLLTQASGKRWTSKWLLVQSMENVSAKTNIVRVQSLWFKLRWMNASLSNDAREKDCKSGFFGKSALLSVFWRHYFYRTCFQNDIKNTEHKAASFFFPFSAPFTQLRK